MTPASGHISSSVQSSLNSLSRVGRHWNPDAKDTRRLLDYFRSIYFLASPNAPPYMPHPPRETKRALAKAGKSVLYLDCHEYYGQDSASFSFTQLLDWAQSNGSDGSSSSSSRAGNADNDTNNSADGNNSGPAGGPSAKASAAPSTRVPFDSATAGTTIARAHVRNELKKERDVAAAAEKAKSVGGDSSSGGPADGDGEDKVTEEEEAETEQGGSNVTAPANGAASDTPASSGQGPTGTNPPEQQNQQPPPQRTEEDQEKGDEEPTAEEKAAQKATEDAAAAVRLRSLDLALLPLSYHGCGTRAGAPSDACVAERRRREAAEEAAAAAGRFLGGRQPQPSHPAWAGRREPSKVEGREGVGAGGVAGEEEGLHPAFWGYRAERRPCAADLVRLSRSFNLDLTSKVCMSFPHVRVCGVGRARRLFVGWDGGWCALSFLRLPMPSPAQVVVRIAMNVNVAVILEATNEDGSFLRHGRSVSAWCGWANCSNLFTPASLLSARNDRP